MMSKIYKLAQAPGWAPLVYGGVAALILGPLLMPGYVLTLDMVFTPQLPAPAQVTSSYLFNGLLYVLNQVLPADLIQKLMLVFIFVMAGWGMHRLVVRASNGGRQLHQLAPYIAGVLYTVNPFTYDRLMAGQYAVLLGYALLPWLAAAGLAWRRQPGWRTSAAVVVWLVAVSVVSIHSIVPAGIVLLLAVVGCVWRRYIRWGLGILGGWVLLSSYWLLPLLGGQSSTATVIGSFTNGDRQAFATVGGNVFERLANVAGLQGFWAEDYALYALPQDSLPFGVWQLAMVAVLLLVVLGGLAAWRRGQRRIVGLAAGCIVIGLPLAAGVANGWLASAVPLFGGYREPQKFAMLVAMGYGLLAAYGADVFLRRYNWLPVVVPAGVLLLLPLAITPTMPWGATGQLRAVQYPPGWQSVARIIGPGSHTSAAQSAVLVLPWHLYLNVDFAARVVANPAPKYFGTITGRPIIASADPQIGEAATIYPNQVVRQADSLVAAALEGRGFDGQLNNLNVEYVILGKDSNFRQYEFLERTPELQKVYDDDAISLYRNRDYSR